MSVDEAIRQEAAVRHHPTPRANRRRAPTDAAMAWGRPSIRNRTFVWLVGVAVTVFVVTPLIVMIGVSFSANAWWEFPPPALSLQWYERLFSRPEFVRSLWVSLGAALIAAGVGLVVGLLAAVGIVRGRRGPSSTLGAGVLLPLLLPGIAIGLGVYVLYIEVGVPINIGTLALGQVILLVPFSTRLLMVGLTTINPNVERAARNLGARPHTVFFRVSLPLMRTAVVASALLLFVNALEDTAVALFVNNSETITVPVRLLFYQELEPGPLIAAGGTILMLLGAVLALLVSWFVGIGRAFGVTTGKG